jgi:ankyrin repeat protein
LVLLTSHRRRANGEQDGDTALLLACDNGHINVARWLVTEVGIDARTEKDNVSAGTAAAACVLGWVGDHGGDALGEHQQHHRL